VEPLINSSSKGF